MSRKLIRTPLMIDSPVPEMDGSCKYTKVVKVEDQGYHMHRTSGRCGVILCPQDLLLQTQNRSHSISLHRSRALAKHDSPQIHPRGHPPKH